MLLRSRKPRFNRIMSKALAEKKLDPCMFVSIRINFQKPVTMGLLLLFVFTHLFFYQDLVHLRKIKQLEPRYPVASANAMKVSHHPLNFSHPI